MNVYAHTCKTHSRFLKTITFLGLLIVLFGATGCNKLKARDLLNKGVAAFSDGQYDASIEAFKQAKELDPELLNARLYLATAYATEYIPGAPSDENIRKGEQAIAEFQDVLSRDPSSLAAIDGVGSILFQMAGTPFDPDKFQESKQYHQRHISFVPDDPEPYYWIGVVNWTLAYRGNAEMRQLYNTENPRGQLKETDPLPESLRGEFVERYGQLTDEGLSMLEKAVQLRLDYADAMAYQSLLFRQKADMVDDAMRPSIEKQADDLLDQVKEIKQRALEQQPEF